MKNQASVTSRHWISMSRRWQPPLLERRNVVSQRRNVVAQRRDVSFTTLWNVATLDPMSQCWIYSLSITSQRWVSTSRRWQLHPRESRDIEPERRDVAPVLCPEALIFVLPMHSLVRILSHLHCFRPPTTLSPLPPPVLEHPYWPSAPV